MQILYDNNVFDAAIDSSTEHPEFTFSSALIDRRLSRVGRTLDVDDQWIKFSFTAAIAVTHIAILNHNFTSSAVVTIEANTSDSWTTPAFSHVCTIADEIICNDGSTHSYQYWRITIDDPTNTNTYLELAYVYLGGHADFPYYDTTPAFGWISTAEASQSASGQLYGDKRIQLKTVETTHPDVNQTDLDAIIAFFESMDKVTPFILLLAEDSLDVYHPLYCFLTNDISATKESNALTYNLKLSFRECR